MTGFYAFIDIPALQRITAIEYTISARTTDIEIEIHSSGRHFEPSNVTETPWHVWLSREKKSSTKQNGAGCEFKVYQVKPCYVTSFNPRVPDVRVKFIWTQPSYTLL